MYYMIVLFVNRFSHLSSCVGWVDIRKPNRANSYVGFHLVLPNLQINLIQGYCPDSVVVVPEFALGIIL